MRPPRRRGPSRLEQTRGDVGADDTGTAGGGAQRDRPGSPADVEPVIALMRAEAVDEVVVHVGDQGATRSNGAELQTSP